MNFMRIFCLIIFSIFSFQLHAQNVEEAKKLYKTYTQLRPFADTSFVFADSVAFIGQTIVGKEIGNDKIKPDTLFVAELCKDIGYLYSLNTRWDLAATYQLISARYFENKGKLLESGIQVTKYLYSYDRYTRYKNQYSKINGLDTTSFSHGNADTAIWLSVRADQLKFSKNRDTIFARILAGKFHHIKFESKFDVFTTYDTFAAIDRDIVFAGTGFITEMGDFTSYGYIVLDSGFRDTLYDRDAFEVKIYSDRRFVSGPIAKIGAYNVQFKNHESTAYYSQGPGNLTFNQKRYYKPLLLAIQKGISDAADYYNEIDSTILQTRLVSGPYAGYSYDEVFKKATLFDLEQFFEFVGSYPGKYINNSYNFVEVYLTWVLNNCLLGKNELQVLKHVLSLSADEIKDQGQIVSGYYKNVTNADSLFVDLVYNQFPDDRKKRIEQLEKMHAMAVQNKMYASDSFYRFQLVWEYLGNREFQKSLDQCTVLWPKVKGSHKMYLALYMGIVYSRLDKNEDAVRFLDSSLAVDSTYYFARGYKGWNLLKMGKVKQAFPYCEFSYNVDSSSLWTNANLAHAYFFKGDKAAANRLYMKCMNVLSGENDFYEGLIQDFEYFINNGVREDEFLELKKKYTQLYLSEYKNKVIGDSLYSRAKSIYEKENYANAAEIFKYASEYYALSLKPDWSDVRLSQRWAAYNYYKSNQFKKSLDFYKKASITTLTHSLGEDNLISDYNDMSNLYDWLNDTLRQLEYGSKASSLEVALRERREQKRLFALIVGYNGTGYNDSFAVKDAELISTALQSGAALHFDGVRVERLTGKTANAENVKRMLDTAIYSMKENDVFVFYYAGYGRMFPTESLSLYNGNISMRELAGYLGQIPAGRQIHIADCNGLNWRELYQRGNFSLLTNEKKSLVFMGLKNSRIENHTTRQSVISEALHEAWKQEINDGQLTATEWISGAAMQLMSQNNMFALETQTFGHDFIIGKAKTIITGTDTVAPVIELYGAYAVRGGGNISIVSGSNITAGQITDDSRIVSATANGLSLNVGANGRFELPKNLIGTKNVIIEAKDEFGNYSKREFEIRQSEVVTTNQGTRYAYLFASDDYQYWTDLTNPIFDAESIGELLKKNYGYQVEILKNPSRIAVREKLDQIRRFNYRSNDQLLVFFAGHGIHDSAWGGYYVCPESELPEKDKYYETYFPQQRIADLLDGSSCKNVFLVMDVCFGGKMFDKQIKNEYRNVNDGNNISADEFVKRQLQIPCRQFLTSGGNNYVADGTAGSHSPFASRFIAALNDGAMNKEYITASEIMDYLRTMRTVGNDKKSFPRYGFFGGDRDAEYVLKVTTKIKDAAVFARN